MDQTTFLLEYLKEQYAQARQYETRETNATTFLTALAGALLGLGFKDGATSPGTIWIGLLLIFIGLANWWINRAHIKGALYHTGVAGRTRRALEAAIPEWTAETPTEIRNKVRVEQRVRGPESGIREHVHKALLVVPLGVIALGILAVLISLAYRWFS